MDASPEELQAVQILWRKEHPGDGDVLPEDQIPVFLAEIRARRTAIEMEAMQILTSTMRQRRRTPRRHQRVVTVMFIAVFVAIVIALIILSLR